MEGKLVSRRRRRARRKGPVRAEPRGKWQGEWQQVEQADQLLLEYKVIGSAQHSYSKQWPAPNISAHAGQSDEPARGPYDRQPPRATRAGSPSCEVCVGFPLPALSVGRIESDLQHNGQKDYNHKAIETDQVWGGESRIAVGQLPLLRAIRVKHLLKSPTPHFFSYNRS